MSKTRKWIFWFFLPLCGGIVSAAYSYWQESYFGFTSYLTDFIIGFLLLGVAMIFLERVLRQPRNNLALSGYSLLIGLFLNLYAAFLTAYFFCPVYVSDYYRGGVGGLGAPCNGWPLLVDFHYTQWPLYAILNLLIWVFGTFIVLILWKSFWMKR